MPGTIGGRIRLAELNDQLTCKLCRGYFIDATTIVECLHSFCKSCIVKYLKANKYCPICDVQVHECKPLLGIKPDYTLQDIVYKLVPGCYQKEMRFRREFYDKHPEIKVAGMSPEARGEPIESHIYSADELLNLSLEYYNPTFKTINIIPSLKEPSESEFNSENNLSKIYLRCPAAVTVYHLQKLIRAKYELSDAYRIDFMYKEESLCTNYTLMDVMYIYHWRRKVPLNLNYRIFKPYPKRLALSDEELDSIDGEKIENESKKVNIDKISNTSLTKTNNLSNESSNTEAINVPMSIDNSNQSDLPDQVQDSSNTTINNMSINSGLNVEQNQIVLSIKTTTTTTTTTTTSQVSQQSSMMSTCSTSNITKSTNLNISNNPNDSNNNNNNNDMSNNSSIQSGNSSTTQESFKTNLEVNIPTSSPRPSASTNTSPKPTIRKMEILTKGMCLNKIYAKIGNSGSKINDICSKIRNLSKKKSKVEKPKPGMPTLLKVTKKSVASTPEDVVKRVDTIPNVLIYSPVRSNKLKANGPRKDSIPKTTDQLMPVNFEGSRRTKSDKLSKAPEIPSFKYSPLETLNSLEKKTVNKLIETQVKKPQTLSPNTSGTNDGINSSGKKPSFPKPPRLSKTKSLINHSKNNELVIKPLSNNINDPKESNDKQSIAATVSTNTVMTTGLNSLSTIDLKAFASIASTNTNSIMSSLPAYLPNRSYQSTSFLSANSNFSVQSPNSSINMFPNHPSIPNPMPNINMTSSYSNYTSPAFVTNMNRYSNFLLRSQISTSKTYQPKPPSISGKTHHNISNEPSTTAVSCPPGLTIRPVYSSAMQRVPSSNSSSPLKSSRTTVANSNFNVKSESPASTTMESIANLSKEISHNSNIFNLSTTTRTSSDYASDLSKNSSSSSTAGNILINSVACTNSMKSFGSDCKAQGKNKEKSEDSDKKEKIIKNKEKERSDEDKRPGDIGNKETGEKLSNKGNKNDDEMLNDEARKNYDDRNKEIRDTLMRIKNEETDLKFDKCITMMINDLSKKKSENKNTGKKNAELPKTGAEMKLNK